MKTHTRAKRRLIMLAAWAAGLCVWPAAAQINVTPDGRLLDANPAYGGSRINAPRPLSPVMLGNAIANGNVRGGFALRSFSPISDPTSFRASLGSGGLSPFLRDTASVADAYNRSSLAYGPALYFDPSRTAPTAAFLRRMGPYTPTLPQGTRSTGRDYPGQLDFRAPVFAKPQALGPTNNAVGSTAGPTPLASTLFGVQPLEPPRPDWMKMPEPGAPEDDFQRQLRAEVHGNEGRTAPVGQDPWLPLDYRLPLASLTNQPAGAADAVLRYDPTQLLAQRTTQLGPQPRPESEPLPDQKAKVVDRSLLPGQSVFTDMRMAVALEENPGAPWFKELQQAVRSDPTLAQQASQIAGTQAKQFAEQLLSTPIRTFAGKAKTPINEMMLRAELLMDAGEYLEAARQFQRVAIADPLNPLPLIGRGHALLAAGDYLSAAESLLRGLERFPDLARFRVDLAALMGGGEIVDVRRADLMQLLKDNENPQLRFLLGYLEVHSGNVAAGMKNLEKAAAESDFTSFIRRYPKLLRRARFVAPQAPASQPANTQQQEVP